MLTTTTSYTTMVERSMWPICGSASMHVKPAMLAHVINACSMGDIHPCVQDDRVTIRQVPEVLPAGAASADDV
jgi:hypothetical protein